MSKAPFPLLLTLIFASFCAQNTFVVTFLPAIIPSSDLFKFSRPEVVDIATYKYPGEPNYPGMGPKAIPEQWEADERTVHYMIPKTFVDNMIAPKMGSTGLYTLGFGSVLALLSRVSSEAKRSC